MKDNLFIVEHPVIKRDVTILRDKNTESETFRAVLQRVSNLLAAEVSKKFSLTSIMIETPLEKTEGSKLTNEVILVPVLRAGLGMVNGFLQIIPEAKVGHIGLQRDEETLQPIEYYYKIPKNLASAEVVMLDPMLATGGSASEAISYLKKHGAKNPVFVCIVAAPEGVKKLLLKHPDIKIYAAALDRELNSKGYILPGLGDAGDRTFGTL
ncbi:MAG: uracil phosphoribosyltransferase [Ignavibacteriota bacterium]|jgi:uracil phosphoribosyltransferase|nr:MAG: uracil phosphoribosyltransferase [Ignavibacterium sp.]MBL1154545.1 uracil phosphoribosyltransferase [Ignavibacteriota bacterium]MCO6447505.1 uracil phosphoribosyltransferase [Ignavibacterium album]MCZ2267289.1 uracil phosphoribosyltransferase [Ignavibacteriales bacterium]MDX9711905.1 uracil phosphoribosyltransferase [Ignavibacteriaceae bacterium]